MRPDLRIHCNRCSGDRRHAILKTVRETDETGDVVHWQIVECAGCEAKSFYHVTAADLGGTLEITATSVFPTRQLRPVKSFPGAPDKIDRLYRETIEAFNNGSLVFCAGGLRALVEGICADLGVQDGPTWDEETSTFLTKRDGTRRRGKDLACKIEGLAEKGLIPEREARALHEHRLLGNDAVHELEVPERRTLGLAVDILEHVLQSIYSIEAHTQDLRRKRRPRRRM